MYLNVEQYELYPKTGVGARARGSTIDKRGTMVPRNRDDMSGGQRRLRLDVRGGILWGEKP